MSESAWSVLGMLAVVVLILFLAYWATRWIGAYSTRSPIGRVRAAGDGRLEALEQLTVGRNERILLVRLQDRCYLLGVTAERITLLKELEGDEAKAWLAAEEIENEPAPPSFLDVLKENLRKKK